MTDREQTRRDATVGLARYREEKFVAWRAYTAAMEQAKRQSLDFDAWLLAELEQAERERDEALKWQNVYGQQRDDERARLAKVPRARA